MPSRSRGGFFRIDRSITMNLRSKIAAAALMTVAAPFLSLPANAMPIAPLTELQNQAPAPAEAVQYRGGGRGSWRAGRGYSRGYGGVGVGAGLAAGAIIGGAIAGSAAYGYAPYGYQGYATPGYIEDDVDDGYVAIAPHGGGAAYCAQRYRSYDPQSGTYLGYDGLRHPCP
jgi:hypothetical protein